MQAAEELRSRAAQERRTQEFKDVIDTTEDFDGNDEDGEIGMLGHQEGEEEEAEEEDEEEEDGDELADPILQPGALAPFAPPAEVEEVKARKRRINCGQLRIPSMQSSRTGKGQQAPLRKGARSVKSGIQKAKLVTIAPGPDGAKLCAMCAIPKDLVRRQTFFI
jgi:hypothetical protein